MFEILFDWRTALGFGTDVVFYLAMALIGTVFFTLRLILALFFGDGSDIDVGVDGDDGSFGFFSLLSILAFFMGAGWMGLTCRIDWDMSRMAAAAAAAGFGTLMMSLATGLIYMTRRLNRSITYDLATSIGRVGRVYMTIPAKGKGVGQVEVDVSGRRKIIEAVSRTGKINQFDSVKVVGVRDDHVLEVEPLG